MFQKKSLGQNFLNSKKALGDIVDSGDIKPSDIIVEAGPGMGVLTSELLKSGAKVIAIEKDRRLIEPLSVKFQDEIKSGQLNLIEGDILEFSPEKYDLRSNEYKIIANIPYYITGLLLRKFLAGENQPSKIVFMIQKEVAQRIVAKDNKESLMSLGVKAYGTPRYVATVTKGNFNPPPKVDSAILAIENISRANFESAAHEENFWKITKKAFGQKRKMLTGTLKIDPEILKNMSLSEKSRPEELSLKDWLTLSKII